MTTTIELPPDIAGPLAEAARQRGMTPEQLALDALRTLFPPPAESGSLYDRMKAYIGVWDGPPGPGAETISETFADDLEERHRRGKQ